MEPQIITFLFLELCLNQDVLSLSIPLITMGIRDVQNPLGSAPVFHSRKVPSELENSAYCSYRLRNMLLEGVGVSFPYQPWTLHFCWLE